MTSLTKSDKGFGLKDLGAVALKEPESHRSRIYADLKRLGASQYNLWLPETHNLEYIVHPGESIKGIIYGHYTQKSGQQATLNGRGMLVVTNKRVIFVDKKPLYVRFDQITFGIISGITYAKAGIASANVTLRTRTGDYTFRTFNLKSAKNFIDSIEEICFGKRDIIE